MGNDGLQYDVIIIGSGPTGSAAARTILEERPSSRVLMVELGPAISTPLGRHVRTLADGEERRAAQIASQGPTQVPYATPTLQERSRAAAKGGDRWLLNSPGSHLLVAGTGEEDGDGLPNAVLSTNVGGMGAHWTGACPRPGAGERVPWISDAELDDLLSIGEKYLNVTTSAYPSTDESARLRTVLGQRFDEGRPVQRRVQPMPVAVTPGEWGLPRPAGTDVILGALLTPGAGLELRSGTLAERVEYRDGRVSGVQLKSMATGQRELVPARAVVVAGDALRTPQLLFASDIRPPALGRYLNDHHNIVGAIQVSADLFPASSSDHLTFGVTWVPYAAEQVPLHGMISQASAAPNALPEGTQAGRVLELNWLTTAELSPDNRLLFSDDEVDWCGMPKIDVQYRLSKRDTERVELALETVREVGESLGVFLPDEAPTLMPYGNSRHYQGTVRAGESDDGTSVCDPWGRVWGFDNLFVAGNGVIPTETACNPTLTSVALAIRSGRAAAELL